jgi:hypothetical protein
MRNQCGSQSAGFCVWGGKSQLVLCLAVGLLAFTSAARGAQITDDFNDGNDSANPTWTRYDPLAAFGSPASFGFPNGNSYRIQTPGFPTSPAGAPRAASYLNNQNYSTFSISVDVLDWNNSINQAYGVLARLNSVGLGATTGYALTYTPTQHTIDITRITGESQTGGGLGSATVTLDPAKDYRFVFTGVGSTLTGAVYDLTDLSTPVATATGTDGTYTNGFPGLLVFDNSGTNGVGGDATFDNFVASDTIVPEPAGAAILGVVTLFGLAVRRCHD